MSVVAKSLDRLAEQINEEHRAFRRAFKATYRSALRAGDLLNEAKEQAGHGNWTKWVEDNCEFSYSTAARYKRIARNRPEIDAKLQDADPELLGIRAADPSEQVKSSTVEVLPTDAPEPSEATPKEEEEEDSVRDIFNRRARAHAVEKPHEVVEILRTRTHELVVRFRDKSRGAVIRSVLEDQGWTRCEHCRGFGLTKSTGEER